MTQLPLATAEELDIDAGQMESAYALLQAWSQGPSPPIPGAALAVGRGGKLLEPRYFGRQSPLNPDPIRRDGAFLLASISKPLTYLAALILVERGLLNLSDRVVRYFPEFAANGKHRVQLHHLFTHTSGLPDMLPNNQQLRLAHAPISEFVRAAVCETKLDFPAGENYQYQSMGTLIVAALVEKLSGHSLPDFLQREVFEPLGMTSTSLGARSLDPDRIVSVELASDAAETDCHWNSEYWRNFGSPWGGLFSTPEDMAVLCQCMLQFGRHESTRLWSRAVIELATTNRLDDYPEMPESVRRTIPWGLGWQLNRLGSPDCFSDLLSRDAFGHTGATGTMVWMDRKLDGFFILFTTAIRQKAPWRLVRLANMAVAAFH
jgi:CubicO group peptidase (beta-lactamase class C family)